MIKVRMTNTKGQIQEMAAAVIANMRGRAIRILARAGEEAVNTARDRERKSGNDWNDQTGNLRSSIGYIICEDGEVISQSSFEQVKSTAEEGPTTGVNYAKSIAPSTKGLALIVVAGMDYAVYVADRGYDVLSSAQILAQNLIPQLFAKQAEYDKKNG